MEETVFPPTPNWFLPNVIACRHDGLLAYGSRCNLVILRTFPDNSKADIKVGNQFHDFRVTAVAFPPVSCDKKIKDTVVSCSDDGQVILWELETVTPHIKHKCHWEDGEETGKVISLDWSLANTQLVVSIAENDTIVVWNVLANTASRFLFRKLAATILSCSPQQEKIVAVGTKYGLVHVINLVKNGEVLFRLRGHDEEVVSLSWCPFAYNVLQTDKVQSEMLLASGSRYNDIYIWRAGTDGHCETVLSLPTAPMSKCDNDQYRMKTGPSSSYTALFWAAPYKLFATTSFGELVLWDFKLGEALNMNYSKGSKKNLKNSCWKVVHGFHNRGVYAVVGTRSIGSICEKANGDISNPAEASSNIVFEENGDRGKENKETSKVSPAWELNSDEPVDIWTSAQDGKLVSCRVTSEKIQVTKNLHTLNGFVYFGAVSPHDPNRIAVAVGDGMIRLWNLTEKHGGVHVYWQKIKDKVMSLAWHPTKDGLLAYGTSEGRVGLIETNTNKLPTAFKPCYPRPMFSLSWGPPFHKSNDKSFDQVEYALYSINDNILFQFNPAKKTGDPENVSKKMNLPCKKQTDVAWKPDYSLLAVGNEDGSICLLEPVSFKVVATVQAYNKLVQSLVWHPTSTTVDSGISPYDGYFTSGTKDIENEIRVFKCVKTGDDYSIEKVAALKGHQGYIQSVSWNPHIGGKLVSNSFDGTVQIWDVPNQTPICNYDLGDSQLGLFSIWSPVDPDLIITGGRHHTLVVWRISERKALLPPVRSKPKKPKPKPKKQPVKKVSEEKKNENVPNNGVPVAKSKVPVKTKDTKYLTKSWKALGKELMMNCYELLLSENGVSYKFDLLGDKEQWMRAVAEEEEKLKQSNTWHALYDVSLWQGNIKELIEEKMKTGYLDDYLLSLTPMVSPRLWQEACLCYSKSLAERQMYCKAATYLLACHKVEEAIDLLMNSGRYLEALCIARCRLHETDPKVELIVRKYAGYLTKVGNYDRACQCYVYLKDYQELMGVLEKTKGVEQYCIKAVIAKHLGNTEREISDACEAISLCFEENDLLLASTVYDNHKDNKIVSVLFYMLKTLHDLDSSGKTPDKDIITSVREICEVNEDITEHQSCIKDPMEQYQCFKIRLQLFKKIGRRLSLACLTTNKALFLTEIIKAIDLSCKYLIKNEEETAPLYQVCLWLAPHGFLADESVFNMKDESLAGKIQSLRAFLCVALIEHLTKCRNESEVSGSVDLLKQLTKDLLNVDNFNYFKKQLEVKRVEKKVTELSANAKKEEIASGVEHDSESDELRLELGILKSLKEEIERFEQDRIAVPNPVSSYFQLRIFCEAFADKTDDVAEFYKEVKEVWAKLDSN